jgi:hypothetical protein
MTLHLPIDAYFLRRDAMSMFHENVFSFHFTSVGTTAQGIFFWMAAIFAICMMAGYYTTVFTFASWIMLSSLHTRNSLLLDASDDFLRVLLFWAMFLPLGKRFSLDRIISEKKKGLQVNTLFCMLSPI